MPAKRTLVKLTALAERAEAARPRQRGECPPSFGPEKWASRQRAWALLKALVKGGPEPEGVTAEERAWAEDVSRIWLDRPPEPPRPPGDWTHEFTRRYLRDGQ